MIRNSLNISLSVQSFIAYLYLAYRYMDLKSRMPYFPEESHQAPIRLSYFRIARVTRVVTSGAQNSHIWVWNIGRVGASSVPKVEVSMHTLNTRVIDLCLHDFMEAQ